MENEHGDEVNLKIVTLKNDADGSLFCRGKIFGAVRIKRRRLLENILSPRLLHFP